MQLKKILLLAVLPVLLCPLRLGAENQPGIKASLEKGKVLLDIPDSLLGRTWAMASTVRAISDVKIGNVGLKDVSGLKFYTFEKVDSTLRLKEVSFDFSSSEGNILNALSDCHTGATVEKFKIKSSSTPKRSVVDATDFFLSDRKELDPTERNPMGTKVIKKNYKKDLSYVCGAKCFEDNFSVTVSRTYTYEVKKKDVPLTIESVASFLLLPEKRTRNIASFLTLCILFEIHYIALKLLL